MAIPDKPTPRKRRLTVAALVIAAAFVVASTIVKRGKPERLIEFDLSIPQGKICGGTFYWTADPRNIAVPVTQNIRPIGVRVLARQITGGPERIVCEEDPNC